MTFGLFGLSSGVNAQANKHVKNSKEIVFIFKELCLQYSNLIELSQTAIADRWKPKSIVEKLEPYLFSLNSDAMKTRHSIFKKGKYFLVLSETTNLIFHRKTDGANLVENSCEVFYPEALEPLSSEPLFEILGKAIESGAEKNMLLDGSVEASVQTWRYKIGAREIGVLAQFATPKFQASNIKLIHVAGAALRAQYFVESSVSQNEPISGRYRFDAVLSPKLKTVER